MTRPVRLPAPHTARRSHAERTAATRARILAAVVESIAEVGFQRSTASEITRRAGVTWGAVQHHFGGKDGILVAVLEDSFDRFAHRLSGIEAEGATPEERVSLFVDRAWEHFESAHFRSTLEILLHYAAPAPERAWQGEMLAAWNRIWSSLFDDGHLSRSRRIVLQHYTISTLWGLASMKTLGGPTARIREGELGLLKRTLVRELEDRGGEC